MMLSKLTIFYAVCMAMLIDVPSIARCQQVGIVPPALQTTATAAAAAQASQGGFVGGSNSGGGAKGGKGGKKRHQKKKKQTQTQKQKKKTKKKKTGSGNRGGMNGKGSPRSRKNHPKTPRSKTKKPSSRRSKSAAIRAAFIGNSYTFYHDMPSMVRKIAKGEGKKLRTNESLHSGYTFKKQSGESQTIDLLTHDFDFVVMQDQSNVPSGLGRGKKSSSINVTETFFKPRLILKPNTQPIFYSTWGHLDGYSSKEKNVDIGFEEMNTLTTQGYLEYQAAFNAGWVPKQAKIAPAGAAFKLVYDDGDNAVVKHAKLYMPDATHPSTKGSYLVACLFYSIFFESSPQGLTYWPIEKMNEDEAKYLQNIAVKALATVGRVF